MTETDDIERLIARVALGDRAAFSDIYLRTSAKLFGVVLRVLQDRGEAEEALQDTYVKLWRNAGRYRVNGLSPMTWLITIARNTALDRRRRRSSAQTAGDVEAEMQADPGPGPEAWAIGASDRAQLVACFGELQEARAEAVRRAYLEGDSYAELAAHFEVPLNTMRTWLRRSLLRLRECLSR